MGVTVLLTYIVCTFYYVISWANLSVAERYKSLSSTSHQLQFLELQRDLLLEFHQDLFSNSNKQARVDPISPLFVAYLNASHYIAVVLEEWGEQTVRNW